MPRGTSTITKRQLDLRRQLWPDLQDNELWTHTKSKGFTNVPRAMPLILLIMDVLAPKHHPVSSTYFDLWCRQFDEKFVSLNKPREMAFAAGFVGQRAERTWLDRVKILAKLKFLRVKPGPSGPYTFALIVNPFKVIESHFQEKAEGLTEDLYNALLSRVAEVGAQDFTPSPLDTLLRTIQHPVLTQLPTEARVGTKST